MQLTHFIGNRYNNVYQNNGEIEFEHAWVNQTIGPLKNNPTTTQLIGIKGNLTDLINKTITQATRETIADTTTFTFSTQDTTVEISWQHTPEFPVLTWAH